MKKPHRAEEWSELWSLIVWHPAGLAWAPPPRAPPKDAQIFSLMIFPVGVPWQIRNENRFLPRVQEINGCYHQTLWFHRRNICFLGTGLGINLCQKKDMRFGTPCRTSEASWHLTGWMIKQVLAPVKRGWLENPFVNISAWFATCFFSKYIGNNDPNWLIFFRGVETTNQMNIWF